LHEIGEALAFAGVRIRTVAGDVTAPAVRAALVEEAFRLGSLTLVVNNASELGTIAPLLNADLAEVERVFHVNVVAPIALAQAAAPLLERARGVLVNISSDAAVGAYPGWGAYGASKAALDLVSRTLAAELSDRGVAVVSVDPGDMRTRMHQDAFPGEDISDRPLPEVTAPFWQWLFDQEPLAVSGRRFRAQATAVDAAHEEERWLQPS
jgi:NAD(P)-dependent dehydrogenase (short-subunit alcohol dehydrogenase family)